ncbi:FecR domain-containing protein [Sulfurimonas sp.]
MKFLFIFLLILSTSIYANIGKITALKGDATLIRDSKSTKLNIGSIIEKNDQITTAKKTRLQIIFKDKTIISIGQNSSFSINDYFFDEKQPKKSKALFNVGKGVFKSITGAIGKIAPEKFKLKTKTATIGIRGTVFFGEHQNGVDSISCTEGAITVTTPLGSMDVSAGEMTRVEVGKPPLPPVKLSVEQKQKMEKSSGASANEQESGQGKSAVGKADSDKKEEKSEKKEEKSEKKEENKKETTENKQEKKDTTESSEDSSSTLSDEPDSEPLVLDSPEETPVDIPEIPVDIEELVDETQNEIIPDEVQVLVDKAVVAANNVDVTSSSDLVTVAGSGETSDNGKTATYDGVLYSGGVRLESGITIDTSMYYQSLYDGTSTTYPTFSIAKGVLNGTTTLYSWKPDGTTEYDGSDAGTDQDTFTLTLSQLSLSDPVDGYTGFIKVKDIDDTSIFVDNEEEFFIQRTVTDLGTTEYYQDLVYGIKTSYSSLPSDGITRYVEPSKTSAVGAMTYLTTPSSYYASTSGSYINWKNKKILSYEISGINTNTDDRVFIFMGGISNESGKAIISDATYYEKMMDFSLKQTASGSDIKGNIFGTDYQGFGVTVKTTNGTKFTEHTHGEYRLKSSTTEDATTPTGSTAFKGFANVSTSNTANALEFTIDRDAGNIVNTGSITFAVDNYITTFGGELSAYITDDTFATLGFAGRYPGGVGPTVSDGWLIAVDTGSISTTDDGISWGFWGVDSSSSDIAIETWVAGQSIVSDISSLGTSGSATYQGKAMGFIDGTTYIDPTNSTISLTFDFGANSATASINANSGAFTDTKTFGTSLKDNTGSTYQISDGGELIKGSFFNNGDTTAGSFKFINGNTATGVYKAKLQSGNTVTGGSL